MKKRLLGILLAAAMTAALLPATAAAAEPVDELYVGDDIVVAEGEIESSSGEGWSYAGGVLTLTNADISGEGFGIYAEGDLTIKLVGDNTVHASAAESDSDSIPISIGIYIIGGSLTITGPGSLNAYSVGNFASGGISVEGDLAITGNASVEAVAGPATGDSNAVSVGIMVEAGSARIDGGSTVIARGGNASAVLSDSGGTLTSLSYGLAVLSGGLTVSDGADVTATGGEAGRGGDLDAGDNGGSAGIYAGGDITIDGAAVSAEGGDALTSSVGLGSESGGIYIDDSSVSAAGGVTDDGHASYGVYASDIIEVNGSGTFFRAVTRAPTGEEYENMAWAAVELVLGDGVSFTVNEDGEIVIGDPTVVPSSGGPITIVGPYKYESDYDLMMTEAEAEEAFEYGEPVYYLIIDETIGSPLYQHEYVEDMSVKAKAWIMNGGLVEGMQIIKKRVNIETVCDATGELYDCGKAIGSFGLESGMYYFLEIAVGERKTVSESDIIGVARFDRKRGRHQGVEIARIREAESEVEFSVFYPDTWLNDEIGIITDEIADLEWDTNYALKFETDEEAELEFGSPSGGNNEGSFTVDVSGQGKVFLNYSTEPDEAIAAANPEAAMHFLTFHGIDGVGVRFNRAGEFVYEMENIAAAYKVVDGKLEPILGLEIDAAGEEATFRTDTLEAYVFADRELADPAQPALEQQPEAPAEAA